MKKPSYEDGYRDALRDVRAWFENNQAFLVPTTFKISLAILKVFEKDYVEFFKLKECYAMEWDGIDPHAPPKRKKKGAEKKE